MGFILNGKVYRYINRHKPTQYDNMPDYSKGKIYKLLNIIDDEIYVGSTTQPLRKHLCEHKCRATGTERGHFKVHHHMAKLGIYNFYIELVEPCACSTK